ncbi:MAG: adenosylmethionine--8-amino-7-oxononanoate transaminase [Rickettsiaceae bacterium]|nr:MAG: adenosylmethionine--8-amino-7-oxononanoate transaminase [Rickettsiaceae bacterium]
MTKLISKDQKFIWHPFTQGMLEKLPIHITKGHESYLYDVTGKKYLDLISSWWVNLHGHANPYIAKAIYDQALTLEHVIFAGFTHQPAVTLCDKISSLLPFSLSKFFFSDNGSTAVEVAIKIAYQFWRNNDAERNIFLSFEGGYHGDTFGAMSVGQDSKFHDNFRKLFFKVLTIPFPFTFNGDQEIEQKEQQSLNKLALYLAQYGSNIAAFILEPLIQGASGMRICRPNFIEQVVSLLKKYNILTICDEIMTGFNRTGTLFAFEQTKCIPDIICLSKGLTGGFLPMALTVVDQKIYQAFLSKDHRKTFMHGHSYTANPLGCAAAIASLELLLRQDTQDRIENIATIHSEGLQMIADIPIVLSTRQIGTIAAFDLDNAKTNMETLKVRLLAAGLLLRPLNNTIYLLPPYCTSSSDLKEAYEKIKSILITMM